MNIVVAVKVVPDDQDIQVTASGELDMSKAHQTISAYDINAIEAAAQLAASVGDAKVTVVTVGPTAIDDSKLKKNILARGADELVMVADDACADMDAYATAKMLASAINGLDGWDLIICGDGSADNYAQQVDVQLAYRLGVPVATAAVEIAPASAGLSAKRKLEDAIETVELSLPCVISVLPDIALPRIPGMKDILAAGKKPMQVEKATSAPETTVEIIDIKAPQAEERKLEVKSASDDGAIEAFASAIKSALQ